MICLLLFGCLLLCGGCAYTQKPFLGTVNSKRYNTLDLACKVVCHETNGFFGFFHIYGIKPSALLYKQHSVFDNPQKTIKNHKSSFRPVFSVHPPGQSHNNHRYSGSRPRPQDDSAALPSRSAYRMTTPSRQHRDM